MELSQAALSEIEKKAWIAELKVISFFSDYIGIQAVCCGCFWI